MHRASYIYIYIYVYIYVCFWDIGRTVKGQLAFRKDLAENIRTYEEHL